MTTRRQFLTEIPILVAAMPMLTACVSAQQSTTDLELIKKNAITDAGEGWSGAKDVPANVTWKTRFGREKEEGEPIIISGTVYTADGKTPAPNTLIYAYHTDVHGIYGRGGEHKHGRFRGWMLTDSQGRYEFASILPASYPDSTISKHIHMTVTTKTQREDWIDSILFEGDRFISRRERDMAGQKGGFVPILKMEKGTDGILRGIRNIDLSKI